MAELIGVGEQLRSQFVDGEIALHPDQAVLAPSTLISPGVLTVHGRLNLSHDGIRTSLNAHCRFTFSTEWRTQNPALRCGCRWVRLRHASKRLRADWHVYSDESLCYILPDEWADKLAEVEVHSGSAAAMATAAFLAANNARWLLYRHFEGYRRRLVEWPPDWPQWAHGDAGVFDYRREQLLVKCA
jgi:hypothetical protein